MVIILELMFCFFRQNLCPVFFLLECNICRPDLGKTAFCKLKKTIGSLQQVSTKYGGGKVTIGISQVITYLNKRSRDCTFNNGQPASPELALASSLQESIRRSREGIQDHLTLQVNVRADQVAFLVINEQ
jgi:hypothetical protein